MELTHQLMSLKMRNCSCAPKSRRTACRAEVQLPLPSSGSAIGLGANRVAGHPLRLKSDQTQLQGGGGRFEKRNCSHAPKLRSGSSRSDDTVPLGVCCLLTAFSRDRIVGHSFPTKLTRDSRHLKKRNVPAAQTVAQRPSALKCSSQSGRLDWAQIGPQVNFLSRFAFPSVSHYKDITGVALQRAQVFAQLRVNVGHIVYLVQRVGYYYCSRLEVLPQ